MALGCVKKGTQSCEKMIKPKNPATQIIKDLNKVPGSVTFPDQESHVVQLSPNEAKILVIPNVDKIVDFSVTVSSTESPPPHFTVFSSPKILESQKICILYAVAKVQYYPDCPINSKIAKL